MLRSVGFLVSTWLLLCAVLPGKVAAQSQVDSLLALGDSAFQQFQPREAAHYYLQAYRADTSNYLAAWKAARSIIDVAEITPRKERRAALYQRALRLANRAVAINPQGAKGYLYRSIALGRVALDSGPRERVRLSREVKIAVQRALALDPRDDAAWHVLGRWHRKLATLSWVEKKFANLFLGGVPREASLDSAVYCFQKAIELNPEGVRHYLQLGITYEAMGEKEKAARAYEKALLQPRTDLDDPELKEQARQRLKKLQ